MTVHALTRLRERYDPNITFDDLMQMRQAIVDGRAKFVTCPHPKAAEYLVPHNGRRFRLVFAQDTRVVLTALPIKGGSRAKPKGRVIIRDGKKHKAG
jgi:hypothetical protein